ncbi:MAG TPA: universal stress protein [Flavisolibacter sp.]|jgi:nucleotide-binding universal stress UspA family protein|nr:universal stress protein [Flavisolibacter sp.]
MKFIVPVDFSDVSVNAAEFAAQMLEGRYGVTMLLFHMYRNEAEEQVSVNRLSWLKETLQLQFPVKVETRVEQGDDFIGSLSRLVRYEDADLVVMAVTERLKIIEDSYSMQMIVQNLCPVLVVPPGFSYRGIQNVAIACDFKNVEQVIPLVPVTKILNLFRPALHIVNVNSDLYISLDEEAATQKATLEKMFAAYRPEFHFIKTFGFHESLRQFIADKQIDIVLTFPRKKSFFNYLLKGNNTRKLVYEAEVPVLAAHE